MRSVGPGIAGSVPQAGMAASAGAPGHLGDLYNPLFDEDGMLKPGAGPQHPSMGLAMGAQMVPPGSGLPTFCALPGPLGTPAGGGGPSMSTAIVKLGVVDLTSPRKMSQPYLDQSIQKGPVCINFVAGACLNPRECGRRHPDDMQEVAHLLEILKRKPCKFGNSCQWRPRCVFRHPEDGPLPDLPGYMGTKGFTGFTGFTGLVPAPGSTEPGAATWRPPGAGERLMVWTRPGSALPLEAPPAVEPEAATGTAGSSASRASSGPAALSPALAAAVGGTADGGEAPGGLSEEENFAAGEDDCLRKPGAGQVTVSTKKMIEEQQAEIERLRGLLAGVSQPPKRPAERMAMLRPLLPAQQC